MDPCMSSSKAVVLESCWTSLDEDPAGALVGLIPISEKPHDVPLSRRFGIQQGAEVRCIDDFSRSSVNSTVQTCEGPKPHTLDVFAACVCKSCPSCHVLSKGWAALLTLSGHTGNALSSLAPRSLPTSSSRNLAPLSFTPSEYERCRLALWDLSMLSFE